ncbi:MAG: class I SAM-dependent methyltransferase [Mycobacterium sp.]
MTQKPPTPEKTSVPEKTLDHPFFARMWTVMSAHETPLLRRLRGENLAGLSGRVLEVGAGTGTNFAYYPDTVEQVVALEPETRLAPVAREAAAGVSVPVTVIESTIETMPAAEPFDAVVCSLVLCSVDDPDAVLRQLNSVLKPGGELRYFEHVASAGWRGGLQRLADFTLWPRIAGNCHTHRHTERAISNAGFTVETARHQSTFPAWVPLPVSEIALGRAIKNP